MNDEPTTADKLRALPWVYAHGATNAAFCLLTVFGSVFMLFLDELGLNKEQIGLLLALFPFCALLAPFISHWVARAGLKRTYLIFWTCRKLLVALLVGTPWVVAWGGPQAGFYFVGAVLTGFSICRAVAETAFFPWAQEFVPNSFRGRYSAINTVLTTAVGALTIVGTSLVLRTSADLSRFAWLFGIGVVLGLVSVVTAAPIPGGQPMRKEHASRIQWHAMTGVFKDRQFLTYLIAIAVIYLGMYPLAVFVPLYMKQQVGLAPQRVVLLETASMCATFLLAVPWGWATDRYGSKPVMVLNLLLFLGYPLSLWLIPRSSDASLPAALGAMFMVGLVGVGWNIGASRLLFNSLVPPAQRTTYMAVYYAWLGLFSGIGPLIGGWVLEHGVQTPGTWFGLPVDAYTPLMVVYGVSVLIAVALMSVIRVEGEMPALSFVAMFFRGDTIGAVSALISYNAIGGEMRRIAITERLGRTRSELNVNELLGALSDPSFNVRYEAIHSIARTRPHPHLIQALVQVLRGPEPDLGIAAAWALGRLGDRRAIGPLREQLLSDYPLMAARSARALAMLEDHGSLHLLLARLHDELDAGVRCAFASALGALRSPAALRELMVFLRSAPAEPLRHELMLAIARIAGDEHEIVRLCRRVSDDRDTALAQAVQTIRRRMGQSHPRDGVLEADADRSADAFARSDLNEGITCLRNVMTRLVSQPMSEMSAQVLTELSDRLHEYRGERLEYLLLAINMLQTTLAARTPAH